MDKDLREKQTNRALVNGAYAGLLRAAANIHDLDAADVAKTTATLLAEKIQELNKNFPII